MQFEPGASRSDRRVSRAALLALVRLARAHSINRQSSHERKGTWVGLITLVPHTSSALHLLFYVHILQEEIQGEIQPPRRQRAREMRYRHSVARIHPEPTPTNTPGTFLRPPPPTNLCSSCLPGRENALPSAGTRSRVWPLAAAWSSTRVARACGPKEERERAPGAPGRGAHLPALLDPQSVFHR